MTCSSCMIGPCRKGEPSIFTLPPALNKAAGRSLSRTAGNARYLSDTHSRNGVGVKAATVDMGSPSCVDSEGQLLEKLDIICREESKVTTTLSPPPALIHHLNVSDDVIRIKGELVTSLSLVIIQGYR